MKTSLLTLVLAAGAAGVLGAQMPGTAAKRAAKNVAAQASARATATPEQQAPAATPVKQQGTRTTAARRSGPAAMTVAPGADAPIATPDGKPVGARARSRKSKADTVAAKPGTMGNAVVATGAAAVAAAMPRDTVVPRVIMREAYSYDKAGRRDPFASLMSSSDLRPTISDLRLTGILYDLSGRRPVAIMRDLITKAQYRVTTGMTLGRMRVAQIKPKVVVFSIEEFGLNRQDSLMLGDSTKVRTK